MKAVMLVKAYDPVTKELGEIQCCQVKKPELVHEDDVLIKVAYASVCGSDPHLLEGMFDLPIPSPCGHELSGTVEALGKGAVRKGLKIGDKVTGNFYRTCGVCGDCLSGKSQFCQNAVGHGAAQAEYIVWREDQVYVLPKGVGLLEASLAEPINIAVRAVELSGIRIGQHAAVSGGGGIGLMAAQLLKKAGAGRVTVLEPVDSKRQRAIEMGADYVLNPLDDNIQEQVEELTRGKGFDVLIESSGNGAAAKKALDFAGRGGCAVFMSMYPKDYEMGINLLEYCYRKELRIQGMYLAQESFQRAVNMLPQMNFKPVIEKIYALDECKQAYEDQKSGKYAKLVFDCSR